MNVLVDDSIISSNVALLPETLMMTMMVMMMTIMTMRMRMRTMMMRMTCFLHCHQFDDWMYENCLVMCEKQRTDGQIVEEGTIHDPS